ncbi:TetR/AcrR family transcriptional regulator [Bacillus sp. F19]|nr:TetR/AcrR family transcriptional regulator [Bacillus sp. F19]
MNYFQKQSEDTINKLIQAGIELFSKQGYSSTSVNQIVKHAGYSKGAFYAHFSTKEEFMLKLIKEGIDFYFEDLKEALNQKDGDLLNKFKEHSMRLVNESYKKGASPMLLQGCTVSNEIPQIKERLHVLLLMFSLYVMVVMLVIGNIYILVGINSLVQF